jgi:vacuolar protein sorting-associated protein 52
LIHFAINTGQHYFYEELFRSLLKHLIDAATNEFLFIVDFFRSNPKDTFNRIYGKAISMVLENLENYLLNCNDSIGILVMIRVRYDANYYFYTIL